MQLGSSSRASFLERKAPTGREAERMADCCWQALQQQQNPELNMKRKQQQLQQKQAQHASPGRLPSGPRLTSLSMLPELTPTACCWQQSKQAVAGT